MENEKTLEILKKMKADPKAKELFEGMGKPNSLEETAAALAQISEKLGYGITAENIREAVKQEEVRRKAETDKVVSDMEALGDDALEDVAGGFYYIDGDRGDVFTVYNKCVNDYQDTRCLNSDACANLVHFYYDCSGEYFGDKEEYNCTISLFCDYLMR